MTAKEELTMYAKNHRWAFDELVVDQKMQEANRLCSEANVQPMFEYLKTAMGDARAVLGALRWLVTTQKRRLKSLNLRGQR